MKRDDANPAESWRRRPKSAALMRWVGSSAQLAGIWASEQETERMTQINEFTQ